MSSICSTLLKKNAEQYQIFSRGFWTKHFWKLAEGSRPLEGATLRASKNVWHVAQQKLQQDWGRCNQRWKTDKLNGYNQPEEEEGLAAAPQPNSGAVCVLLWHTVCQVLYFLVRFYISAPHCFIVWMPQAAVSEEIRAKLLFSKPLLVFPLNFSLSFFFYWSNS